MAVGRLRGTGQAGPTGVAEQVAARLGRTGPDGRQTGELCRDAAAYPLARRIADDLLAGTPAGKVASSLNRDGIPSPTGKVCTH